MLVSEADKKLGMNTQTLRLALQQKLFPFGVEVKHLRIDSRTTLMKIN